MHLDFNDHVYNGALILIEDSVRQLRCQTSLSSFGLPTPQRDARPVHRDILCETSYNVASLRTYLAVDEPRLLSEQRQAYDTVIKSVQQTEGKLCLLDAPGGTGKTFVIKLILVKVRCDGKIALAVASSGIAATLLPGGRTAHSMFKLPINLNSEQPTCNIRKGTALADLLQITDLIIWDECTMAHRAALGGLDRSLRDIRDQPELPMGGITLLLASDFRQTLPIVLRETRADDVKASLIHSPLWSSVEVLRLKTNMRVHIHQDAHAVQFAEDLLRVGDGLIPPTRQHGYISLPFGQHVTTADQLKQAVLPGLNEGIPTHEWLTERAILARKNVDVNVLNNSIAANSLGNIPLYQNHYRN